MNILVIQTASIGDVILATPVLEKLHQTYPDAAIDLLVKYGNEPLFHGHPFLRKVWVWDKREKKYARLLSLIFKIRNERYDVVINIQRFFSSGLITALSKGKTTIGFKKNPLSFFFSKRYVHTIGDPKKPVHEVERNLQLTESLTDGKITPPRLYPFTSDDEKTGIFKEHPYICIAPASLWFTKQLPVEKWIELMEEIDKGLRVYLLGARSDYELCEEIIHGTSHPFVINLAGKISLLESASLIRDARMTYVNDSAPMHLASSVNAPVTAIFCSTVTDFGFGPLSEKSFIVESKEKLDCRPCGLHGYKSCPKGHFKCAWNIKTEQLTETLNHGE